MRTLATAACLLALTGCAIIVTPNDGDFHYESAFGSSGVQGNGQLATDQRSIAAFSTVDLNGPLQVKLSVGAAPALSIEADSNLLPHIHSDSSGNSLKIWVDGNLHTANDIRIVLSTPSLSEVNSNGSGHMLIAGLNGGAFSLVNNGSRGVDLGGRVDRLDVRVHGSGSIDAAGLDSGTADISLTGSGRMNMGQVHGDLLNVGVHGSGGLHASGKVRTLNVALNGSGGADLAGLSAELADLNTNGSGDISVAVSQNLVAQSNGSGRITVYGNPAQRNISGKHVTVVQ